MHAARMTSCALPWLMRVTRSAQFHPIAHPKIGWAIGWNSTTKLTRMHLHA